MTIDAAQARHKAQQGDALLVCAYEDEARCREILLDGAITLRQLRDRLDAVPADAELVFYCDCAADELSTRCAEEYRARGYERARVLEGGPREWKLSGYPMAAETAPENPASPAP
jgi:rhodanese-related sulfurtransferase